ncbi:hypothetical protein [Photobacterium phosphoreum]|uniref:hypothetical protein n=1 Tax=Photobacterium phosphoreum TaxID=659 RepID=UPI0011B1F4E8|nr:hypothetical protein [Photobacterium phosphoreum]
MFSVLDACKKLKISRATLYRRMELNSIFGTVVCGKKVFTEQDIKDLWRDKKQTSENLMTIVSQLSDKIDLLTLKFDSLISDHETMKGNNQIHGRITDSDTKTVTNTSNEKRAEETKKRLFDALSEMSEIPMYRGKPSISGIHKATGIDRGTIAKYLPQWDR